jgi:putative hydrolase of the HAD superfamily
MIRAVIFDLGHTLWDILPDHGDALAAAYQHVYEVLVQNTEVDIPPPERLRAAVSAALKSDADSYFMAGEILEQPPTHTWVQRAFLTLGLDISKDLLRKVTIPLFATELERLHVAPGTVDAVRELKDRGLRLGCVTNTLTDQATIEAMLDKYGFRGCLSAVVVSTELGYRKPHALLFDRAVRDLEVAHPEAVFVGDSPYHDIGGAKAVGMRAVLTRQYAERPWVDGVPQPDATITHLRELPTVIDRLNQMS